MKLVEKLAILYARRHPSVRYGHEDVLNAYLAGFRECRAMYSGELFSLELAPGTYEIKPQDWRELENLGEEEV